MKRHVRCIADATDPGRVYFGAVEVLHGTEADGPTNGVNKNRGDGGVGCRSIAGVDEECHVDGHIYMSCALERKSQKETTAAAKAIDKTPSKNQGEDKFHNSIGTRSDQRCVAADDTGICEYLT